MHRHQSTHSSLRERPRILLLYLGRTWAFINVAGVGLSSFFQIKKKTDEKRQKEGEKDEKESNRVFLMTPSAYITRLLLGLSVLSAPISFTLCIQIIDVDGDHALRCTYKNERNALFLTFSMLLLSQDFFFFSPCTLSQNRVRTYTSS